MSTTVRPTRRWSSPKPGSRGSVYQRYANLAGISPETARDHFRKRTHKEPPSLVALMLRAAYAEQDYEKAGEVLRDIYAEILRVTIDDDEAELLHRCLLIDDEEQVAGRQFMHESTDYNRKQWLMHSYRQLTATVKVITVLEGQAP